MATAAAAAGIVLALHALDRPAKVNKDRPGETQEVAVQPGTDQPSAPGWLTPRPRAAVPEITVRVGAELTTGPGERRRVNLADGSVLYLNANTQVRNTADRQVRLVKGELYVEVSPNPAHHSPLTTHTFIVNTPDRDVQALGTRFQRLGRRRPKRCRGHAGQGAGQRPGRRCPRRPAARARRQGARAGPARLAPCSTGRAN